eukprot:CAMPEP_0182424224 /NCGR_PEP_ID=MMETSP1167-20130531/10391_1 /TAXON_ID=2988 /ORGANISM="Mallomonas Sp, Strain CCMP3275" /LENGTH=485 /DNA_ID=CAMNT_0024603853 /DNA_START=296 /DNA_END=1753 /DNA_ORIENTATION=+
MIWNISSFFITLILSTYSCGKSHVSRHLRTLNYDGSAEKLEDHYLKWLMTLSWHHAFKKVLKSSAKTEDEYYRETDRFLVEDDTIAHTDDPSESPTLASAEPTIRPSRPPTSRPVTGKPNTAMPTATPSSSVPSLEPTPRPSIDLSAIYAEIERENSASAYYESPEPTYAFTIDAEPETIIVTDDEILLLGRRESLATTEALMWTFGTFGIAMCLLYTNRKKIFRLRKYVDNKLGGTSPGGDGLQTASTHSQMGLMDATSQTLSQDETQHSTTETETETEKEKEESPSHTPDLPMLASSIRNAPLPPVPAPGTRTVGSGIATSTFSAAASATSMSGLGRPAGDPLTRLPPGKTVKEAQEDSTRRRSTMYDNLSNAQSEQFMDESAHDITLSAEEEFSRLQESRKKMDLEGKMISMMSKKPADSPVLPSFPVQDKDEEAIAPNRAKEKTSLPYTSVLPSAGSTPPPMPSAAGDAFAPPRWMTDDDD